MRLLYCVMDWPPVSRLHGDYFGCRHRQFFLRKGLKQLWEGGKKLLDHAGDR